MQCVFYAHCTWHSHFCHTGTSFRIRAATSMGHSERTLRTVCEHPSLHLPYRYIHPLPFTPPSSTNVLGTVQVRINSVSFRIFIFSTDCSSPVVRIIQILLILASVPDTCFDLIGSHQWYADSRGSNPRRRLLEKMLYPLGYSGSTPTACTLYYIYL